MQNETMSPAPQVGQSFQQPLNIPHTRQKVSLNPFAHLKMGLGALIKNNLSSGLIAILVSSIVSVGLTIALLYASFQATIGVFASGLGAGSDTPTALLKTFGIYMGVAILAAFITGYFGSVITRIIITGSRGQKENIGHAFSFVLSRLPKIILTYLLIFALFTVGVVILVVGGRISPILAIVLGLVGIAVVIIFALRISYVPLILVDDENPGRPLSVLRRSGELWKKSSGALVLYGLALFIIYIVVSTLLGGFGTTPTPKSSPTLYNDSSAFQNVQPNDPSVLLNVQPAAFSFAIGAVLAYSFLSNCFGALLYSGEASIYNDAREIVDGSPTPPSAGAPVSPVAYGSAPTVPSNSTPPSSSPVVSPEPLTPQSPVSPQDSGQPIVSDPTV